MGICQLGCRRTEQIYHVNLLKKLLEPGPHYLAALVEGTLPVVAFDENLSLNQKNDLRHLIHEFSDVCSEIPGQAQVISQDIRTLPNVIVRQRPYRVPEARRQAIEEEVQKMCKLGVIKESCSPLSSPIVMAPKPDGTFRFCNDFRKLNEVSTFDGYPVPRVDELIDQLGKARFISTLDLTKEYWQVPLTPSAREKTPFSTPSGHWHYRFLPFGLHGAPATFQWMMEIILRPHCTFAAAYLDDVVIHAETWEEHLTRLRKVLLELRRARLTANPRKCHLGLTEARNLGYRIGCGLVKPQEDKIAAVRNYPRPTTKSLVRAFLGFAGYYQCFIPNFSSLACPLTDLTQKRQPKKVQWSPAAEKSFNSLKKALITEPVLNASDFTLPFILQTDASDYGLSTILSQEFQGEEHPVLFLSRQLSPTETKYAAVEREALAIKWAVLELCCYLLRCSFTLVTDHAPLQWMARA